MFSPGEWYRQVPKDTNENLLFRQYMLHRCQADTRYRAAIIEACRQDVSFYISSFVWQYNPTMGNGEIGPFILWDFQEEALRLILRAVSEQHDLTIEKSREMGASWLCLIAMEWLWHFHPWKKFLCISRSEKAVEDEDPDCLFWKIDFLHRYLPGWLKPRIKRRKMYYGNEDNGSTITGQASTGSAGVGGRATAMFIDEFSQIKEDYEVLHRTSDTTKCRIFNFTHLGLDTAAYEITQRVDMRKLQMHWTQHPEKRKGLYRFDSERNVIDVLDSRYHFAADFKFVMDAAPVGGPFPGLRSPWYDAQCNRKGSARAVAMDLDINPAGSVDQFVDQLLIMELVRTYCRPPYWEGDLQYDPDLARPNLEDPLSSRPGGLVKLWLRPDKNGRPPIGEYAGGCDLAEGTGATPSCLSLVDVRTGEKVLEYTDKNIRPEQFAPLVVALCKLFKDEYDQPAKLAWEMCGPGDRFGKHVLDTGFRNVYWRTNEQQSNFRSKPSEIPGWYPSPANRTILLGDYRAALKARQFLNRSEEALKEFLQFRYNASGMVEFGGPAGSSLAETGVNHGDHVIADALAWKMAMRNKAGKGPGRPDDVPPLLSLAWRRALDEERQKAAKQDW